MRGIFVTANIKKKLLVSELLIGLTTISSEIDTFHSHFKKFYPLMQIPCITNQCYSFVLPLFDVLHI